MALERFKKKVADSCDGFENYVKLKVHNARDEIIIKSAREGNPIAIEEANRRGLTLSNDYDY